MSVRCDVSDCTSKYSQLEIRICRSESQHEQNKPNHPNRLMSDRIHTYIYLYSHESLCITVKIQPLLRGGQITSEKKSQKGFLWPPTREQLHRAHL